jgi:hypothetical protein
MIEHQDILLKIIYLDGINLKKSVEYNPAENIQHKLDR